MSPRARSSPGGLGGCPVNPPERQAPGYRCPEVNLTLKLRCDRPAGHEGAHIQDNGSSVQGWGFAYEQTLSNRTEPIHE